MENIDFIRVYCFLFFIVMLLLWKFWKDFGYKNKYLNQINILNEKHNSSMKEIETLSLEITENSKKIDNSVSEKSILWSVALSL